MFADHVLEKSMEAARPMKFSAREFDKPISYFELFPGWAAYPDFIKGYVEDGFQTLDLGGGANPMIARDPARGVCSVLADIDAEELAKAEEKYDRTVCVDATAPRDVFVDRIGEGAYDLIVSHMFLEHVREPDAVHRNCFAALRPGGRAIHAYPINNNLALGLNALLPEALSRRLVRLAQPKRDIDGRKGKFPAYYRRCHSPSARSKAYFESFGFEIERHQAFSGHGYFSRLPILRQVERASRHVAVALQAPLVTCAILVLRKPA